MNDLAANSETTPPASTDAISETGVTKAGTALLVPSHGVAKRVKMRAWPETATPPQHAVTAPSAVAETMAPSYRELRLEAYQFARRSAPSAPLRLEVLQEWQGVVEKVEKDHFVARLLDQTTGDRHAAETAEIPLSDVDPQDRDLVVEGGTFLLIVARERRGGLQTVSQLVFRRRPVWLKSTIDRAEREARDMESFFSRAE